MSSMMNISLMRKILQASKGEPVNLKFWKKNGEIVRADNVIVTSKNWKNHTINIRFVESGEMRTVRTVTIFEFNDIEIYL